MWVEVFVVRVLVFFCTCVLEFEGMRLMVQPRYFVLVVEFHPETAVKLLSLGLGYIFFLATCGPSLSVDTSYQSPVVTWHELLILMKHIARCL